VASGRFKPHAPFFAAVLQDPVLAHARLIAEPWDLGPDGHRTGGFPGRWLEWNDRFRDDMRRWWLGQGVDRATFARRFCASADLFQRGRRAPLASVNFITAHDGFTLADLTSYAGKHNEANGEDNRDGRDGEPCANFGAEGPSEDPAIVNTRRRVQRALVATMLLAQGTPMLAAGDELGHTQGGNNNAYCQDNATGWIDWAQADASMLAFTTRVLALRRSHPLLCHDHWFHPRPGRHGEPVLTWHRPSGQALTVEDWHDGADRALACRLDPGRAAGGTALTRRATEGTALTRQATAGAALTSQEADGDAVTDLWIAFNPGGEPVRFTLPPGRWARRLDTACGDTACGDTACGDTADGVPADPLPLHPPFGAKEGAPNPSGGTREGPERPEGREPREASIDVSAHSLVVLESTAP
jgi:glycogen debranching enzyme GlgX